MSIILEDKEWNIAANYGRTPYERFSLPEQVVRQFRRTLELTYISLEAEAFEHHKWGVILETRKLVEICSDVLAFLQKNPEHETLGTRTAIDRFLGLQGSIVVGVQNVPAEDCWCWKCTRRYYSEKIRLLWRRVWRLGRK